MRAMMADVTGSLDNLRIVNAHKPPPGDGRALVRMTAAGVTPLEHTILSGQMPGAKGPVIPGSEGAGVIEDPGSTGLPHGARVMFAGPYGVREAGTYAEYVPVRKDDLCIVPAGVDDTQAAGLPVAYLTAYLALMAAGFREGASVFAPAIGGSIGNAVTQLAKALGARHAISSTTSKAKAEQARSLGFDTVVDLEHEGLAAGVRRITEGRGVDIVIDGVGGNVLSEGLATLAPGGSLTTLGYSASRKTTVDVTHLIWKNAGIRSFSLFAQPPAAVRQAWAALVPLFESRAIRPIVARVFPLEDAARALRYLVEERPFGRVVLAV